MSTFYKHTKNIIKCYDDDEQHHICQLGSTTTSALCLLPVSSDHYRKPVLWACHNNLVIFCSSLQVSFSIKKLGCNKELCFLIDYSANFFFISVVFICALQYKKTLKHFFSPEPKVTYQNCLINSTKHKINEI